MRVMVVEAGERVDGRAANEIRPIMVKPDYLPLVRFWSFQRGQTKFSPFVHLACSTSGSVLTPLMDNKRYIHHYNFPPFCTGETGRMGSPKRRGWPQATYRAHFCLLFLLRKSFLIPSALFLR